VDAILQVTEELKQSFRVVPVSRDGNFYNTGTQHVTQHSQKCVENVRALMAPALDQLAYMLSEKKLAALHSYRPSCIRYLCLTTAVCE
jgi:hypothetical protein